MKPILKARKGSSVAMAWIYVIEMIFSVGFIYLILDSIVRVQLYNIAIQMNANTTTLTVIMYVWGLIPFMIIGGAILYGIAYTIRKGGEGDYYQ